MIHTNHPIKKENRNKINTARESIERYERAKEMLTESKRYDLPLLKKILADHKGGICAHFKKNTYWGSTIASVVMNTKEKWMEVCWSNPCENKYHRYSL